ncbi:MAG: hypothetical protein HYZ57_00765, partial [Acidobacteria bacterium]|nr:hypothetical protein [Acidobacteriota bacterium]
MLGLLLLSAPLFVGSKTCAACHPRIVANQAKTAHARALAPAADRRVKADWAFGAGAQAITYVSRLDEDHYLEHPLSYYTAAKALAPTPGH